MDAKMDYQREMGIYPVYENDYMNADSDPWFDSDACGLGNECTECFGDDDES